MSCFSNLAKFDRTFCMRLCISDGETTLGPNFARNADMGERGWLLVLLIERERKLYIMFLRRTARFCLAFISQSSNEFELHADSQSRGILWATS